MNESIRFENRAEVDVYRKTLVFLIAWSPTDSTLPATNMDEIVRMISTGKEPFS
jgi:hypothetical protein